MPKEKNVNALVAVAHPDDEIVFCGGTILNYPNWHWTIVTFTGLENSRRICQYRDAMEHLKRSGVDINKYLTLGQNDSGKDLSEYEFQNWQNAIQELNFSPDIVFTHNTMGEYGHTHHKSVNAIINNLFGNIWEFICPGAGNVQPQPVKAKVNKVALSVQTLAMKKEIFNRFYISEHYLWENISDVMDYEFNKGPEVFTSS
jgi:hypothetical protein